MPAVFLAGQINDSTYGLVCKHVGPYSHKSHIHAHSQEDLILQKKMKKKDLVLLIVHIGGGKSMVRYNFVIVYRNQGLQA